MAETARSFEIPSHISEDRVVADFDVYNLMSASDPDPQSALIKFRNRGDIFWSPHNGGHWVLTRADDIRAVQSDWKNFVRTPNVSIPPTAIGRLLPVQSDPPEHGAYRRPLTKSLLPQIVDDLIPKVSGVCVELIESFAQRGGCDFVEEFSQKFPILIFLDLVNLPREDRANLIPFAETLCRDGMLDDRARAFGGITAYLEPLLRERRKNPGPDLFSALANVEIDGALIPIADAVSLCSTTLVAGLDTVAAMLGFVIRHFALHPDHRRQMAERYDDDDYVRRVVEEFLRRYAIASSSRVVASDMEYKGVAFAKGDMILAANTFVGLDDHEVDRPMEVDFHRTRGVQHLAFDTGPHTCPGATLARRELRVFLYEWFKRIPDFGIRPGTTPRMATGMVSSVLALELVWPCATKL